jgi:hypothetical protein
LELTVFDDNHPDLNFYFGTVCGPPPSLLRFPVGLLAASVCNDRHEKSSPAG